MGIGRASGENRAKIAARQAIESPLIEVKIDGARGVLFSVAGGYDMSMSEIQEAAEEITGAVSPDANIIFGASIRPELNEEIVITVVATGFDSDYYRQKRAEEAIAAEQEAAYVAEEQPLYSVPTSDAGTVQSEPQAEAKPSAWENMNKEEEDFDVPPSLRARLRGKK
jgi:cell division protein FtsZ